MKEIEKGIEVVAINDFIPTPTQSNVPHERQVVDGVIAIWKEDPSTESLGISKLHAILKKKHSNWNVSEKRVKMLLKKYGLLLADTEQYTYAKEITSQPTPHVTLPNKVNLIMTVKRGKGLYAKCDIKNGELLWEELPLFLIPPLAHTELIGSGKACTYCGKLANDSSRSKSGISVLRGLDCNSCQETWCSLQCKKLNQLLHSSLKHPLHGGPLSRKIDPNAFADLTEYCIKEQWSGLYAITLIYADCLLDKSGVLSAQFNAMARVSQAVRYKALKSSAGAFDSMQGGALFVEELQEQLWSKGYELFCKVFPKAKTQGYILYEEFMFMMGTYNINNLDSSVYLLQSHLNHHCSPNTKVVTSHKRFEGLKVYAARDIRSGEELNTTYVNPTHTVQQRLRELRVNWGFLCKCQKCKDDLNLQQRRKSSNSSMNDRKEIKKFLDKASQGMSDKEFELGAPLDFNGERRKSVRFDEKVLKVT